MSGRNIYLQRFIDAVAAGIRARATQFPDAMPMADRIFTALKDPGAATARDPYHLPVCRHLDVALDLARNSPVAELADAFAAVEPALAWSRRPGSTDADVGTAFHDGHANAILIGDGGLEARHDLRIGVSLVAPEISYPRHRHPPEELYIVLSPGEWMQNDITLPFKRSGDLIHNSPNVWHAMRATDLPLLAVWCLWLES